MNLTEEQFVQIWRITYASESFMYAKECFEELKKPHNRTIERGLYQAGIISYARPFTPAYMPDGEKGVMYEYKDKIPQELQSTHLTLMNLRNKTIGHTDGVSDIEHIKKMNALHFSLDENQTLTFESGYGYTLSKELLTNAIKICEHLRTACKIRHDFFCMSNKIHSKIQNKNPNKYSLTIISPSKVKPQKVPQNQNKANP